MVSYFVQTNFTIILNLYAIFISQVININIIKNIILLYCYLNTIINYVSVFFNLNFKVNFNSFPKTLIPIKIFISILLKYFNSDLVIIFINHSNIF